MFGELSGFLVSTPDDDQVEAEESMFEADSTAFETGDTMHRQV